MALPAPRTLLSPSRSVKRTTAAAPAGGFTQWAEEHVAAEVITWRSLLPSAISISINGPAVTASSNSRVYIHYRANGEKSLLARASLCWASRTHGGAAT